MTISGAASPAVYLEERANFIQPPIILPVSCKMAWALAYLLKSNTPMSRARRKRILLNGVLEKIKNYLLNTLKLTLHPDKILLNKFTGGIDWVGYKILPHYVVLRKQTRNRMMEKLKMRQEELAIGKIAPQKHYETVNSYLGQLKHCRGHKLSNQIIYNPFVYDYLGKIF